MIKLEKVIINTVFSLLVFMTVLLVFEERAVIPFWIQPIGRMHPMILHFPIGLIVVLVLLNLFRNHLDEVSFLKINWFFLLLTALTTVLAALMGLLLSLEDGYESNIFNLHKWIGVGLAYLSYILFYIRDRKRLYYGALFIGLLGITAGGHFGAELTHGIGFISEPLIRIDPQEVNEDESVFSAVVMPIFDSKCKNCHNSDKRKGELDLTSIAQIQKGGKNGFLWSVGEPNESQLMQRLLLPQHHKEHMPPDGKPQLTDVEIDFIYHWIKAGADTVITLAKLKPSDTVHQLSQKLMGQNSKEEKNVYAFAFADQATIESLNNPFRSVVQLSPDSPGIEVNIFGRETYKPELISELGEIKDQIVSLNLSYLPINDETFEHIQAFMNLETLNLNFTDVKGDQIQKLKSCANLKSLSLSGNPVNMNDIVALERLPLKELFLWNSLVSKEEALEISTKLDLTVNIGYEPESAELIPLTPPILQNDKNVISSEDAIELIHKIQGVKIYYTIDGEEPDSLSGKLYMQPLKFKERTLLKAISYKEGWLPSEVVKFEFLPQGKIPEKIKLLSPPAKKYEAGFEKVLLDGQQGRFLEIPYLSWVGFTTTPLELLADFGETPDPLDSINLSIGLLSNRGAFLPSKIQLWAGDEIKNMHLIHEMIPSFGEINNQAKIVSLPTSKTKFRYYKLVGYLNENKGKYAKTGYENGLFIDQVFFY